MARVEPAYLATLQDNPKNIRNFCILAHVDHGKTTLSDSLVCSNGVFSAKLAGKLRFLDSTEEEQKRGITMHSSAISLLFRLEKEKKPQQQQQSDATEVQSTLPLPLPIENDAEEYLINLVDSPGHIDFSSDVSTATRLCDGALIVIDVLEGLCTQTHAVLYKALKEKMRPCLVLNKLDRLCLEAKLSPVEAFHHLRRIIENANALASSLLKSEMLKGDVFAVDFDGNDENQMVAEWNFAPEKGNVIFASALDCWGFGILKFANMWAKKMQVNKNILQKFFFSDYYINSTTKKILKCDPDNSDSKPMFATMILEPIWQLYDAAINCNDPGKAARMALRGCGVELASRDISTRDPRVTIQAIFRKWLPLPDAILRMVVRCMPNPCEAQQRRLESLIGSANEIKTHLPRVTDRINTINNSIQLCSNSSVDEVVVFVSKMMPVRVGELCAQDQVLLQKQLSANRTDGVLEPLDNNAEVFIALARIFSGVINRNTELYVLNHRHDPYAILNDDSVDDRNLLPTELAATVSKVHPRSFGLYLCLGPSVYAVDQAGAGNIIGIFGLNDIVMKTATLCSTWSYLPMKAITFQAKPMVCVAVEPLSHQDLPQLEAGLQSLYQYDPVVEVGVDDSGQHTMTCLGELHLEQCLKNLIEKFAKCSVKASEPLVFYRESALPISDSTARASLPPPWGDIEGLDRSIGGVHTMSLGSCLSVKIRCFPMPLKVRQLCEIELNALSNLNDHLSNRSNLDDHSEKEENVAMQIVDAVLIDDAVPLEDFTAMVGSSKSRDDCADALLALSRDLLERLITIGPRNICSNFMLLHPSCHVSIYHDTACDSSSTDNCNNTDVSLSLHDKDMKSLFLKVWQRLNSSLVAGFQLAASAGPLMQQPLHGICFAVEEIRIARSTALPYLSDADIAQLHLSTSIGIGGAINTGQLIAGVKDSLRLAMLSCPLRVVEPIYSCDLQCDQSQLGNLYAVLSKRRGEITKEDIIEGTSLFLLSAILPVAESFGFAQELLKKTSGAATTPQLQFSHWQTNDIDPFWKPTTVEELEDHGCASRGEINSMRLAIDKVRKRKGLPVEEKTVAFAEKQRTLTKNK